MHFEAMCGKQEGESKMAKDERTKRGEERRKMETIIVKLRKQSNRNAWSYVPLVILSGFFFSSPHFLFLPAIPICY